MPDGHKAMMRADQTPRIWVMMGHKVGDNSQVLALAEALGLPFEIKRFVYKPYELVTNLLSGPTLAGTVKSQCSPLEPPWPDLVISAGRRNEPICRWIQKQAKGRRVRLVHLGRSWAKIERFDLVVTTPQYRVPIRPNVLQNKTPLHRVTQERLQREADEWAPRLGELPKPYVAVMIGGSSGPYSFDHKSAARLARQASELAAAKGGSLLITTSARTPAPTIETFAEHVTCPSHLFRWSKDAKENPYFAFLGLAESIVVTGDSMSMLTEACATRKPVHIFDLGEGRHAMRQTPATGRDAEAGARPRGKGGKRARFRAFMYRQMMRCGPQRLSRDIRIVHQHLIDSGRAVWLGDGFPPGLPLRSLECLPRAVARVRALFDGWEAEPRVAPKTAEPEVPFKRSA